MPSQTLAIVADTDDGFENQFGYNTGSTILVVNGNAAPAGRWAGISFVLTSTIPNGSTFTKAYFRANEAGLSTNGIQIRIGVEDADPATNTAFDGSSHFPSTASIVGSGHTTAAITWSSGAWYFGESDNNPTNLSTSFQSLMTSYGELTSGHRVNIVLSGANTTGEGVFEDSSAGSDDASLFLEWTAPGGLRRKGSLVLLGVGR